MALNNSLSHLFDEELSVLEHASLISGDDRYKQCELLPEYEKLAQEYQKLLKITQRIFRISDTQAKNLKRRETEIQNLLDNSNQGFLTFGADLLVDREYSAECLRIFNRKINNANIVDLISVSCPEQQALFRDVFTDVFRLNDPENMICSLATLPSMIKVNNNYINVKYNLIESDGNQEYAIMLILTDITEKRNAEDRIIYLSFHDELTALYNRAYIDSMTPQIQLKSSLPLSVIMADMNGLKLTNDVFGHESGDRLLINAARVLQSCCRRSDLVARWGGDEFLIVLPGADSTLCGEILTVIKNACREAETDPIALSVSLGSATTESLNTNLSNLINIAEDVMYSNKLNESKKIRREIIFNIESILHHKCLEDEEHTERLKTILQKFLIALGFSEDSREWSELMMLAMLHDIGKVTIPREMIDKPGPLSTGEWQIVKGHPETGYRMAQSIEEPVLAQAILSIREHYNGQGYPNGLRGEDIPLISRVFAIVDAYDVMTHDRPYRQKRSRQEALKELERCASTQFDPKLVRVFLDLIYTLENVTDGQGDSSKTEEPDESYFEK